jgi:hypothetical protein
LCTGQCAGLVYSVERCGNGRDVRSIDAMPLKICFGCCDRMEHSGGYCRCRKWMNGNWKYRRMGWNVMNIVYVR